MYQKKVVMFIAMWKCDILIYQMCESFQSVMILCTKSKLIVYIMY